MKNSTKTLLGGIVSYTSELALMCVGSYHGGVWASKAKTLPGKVGRLAGIIALSWAGSYIVYKGSQKVVEDYYEYVEEEDHEDDSQDWEEG